MAGIVKTTLIQRVRDLLGEPGWDTTLSTTNLTSTSTTTISVPDATIWDFGAVAEMQDDGEQMYVRSTTVTTNVLTVIRGYNGTTATTTHATNTIIRRDPFFTYKKIQDSIELIAQSLWPYCWKKVTATVTPVASQVWYDLAADAMALINVSQLNTSATPTAYYVYGSKGSRLPVGLKFNVPATLATSGTAIFFPRGFAKIGTDNVQVDYAAKITAGVTVTTNVYTDISDGILAECVAHGAASRLMYLSELPRVTQQDLGMADSSVTPGSRTRAARDMWAQYIFLRDMYHEELRRTMPILGGGVGAMTSSWVGTGGMLTPPYP